MSYFFPKYLSLNTVIYECERIISVPRFICYVVKYFFFFTQSKKVMSIPPFMLGGNPWAQMIVQQQQQQIAAVQAQAQAQAAHAQAAAVHAHMHVAQQMAMHQMSSAPPHRIPEPLSEEKLLEKCNRCKSTFQ